MVGVAILGAGIGAAHFEGYLALSSQFQVLRMIDTDPARAQTVIGEHPVKTSTAIGDALSDHSVELVDICLPPHLHVPVALDALRAGKHVVCEKPIATSLAEVDALRDAIDVSGKQFFPVFQYRFGQSITQLKALIDKGLAGRPFVAALETHWSRDAEYYAAPWRGTWVGENGGAVLGHAIHSHDILCLLFGAVGALTAATATRVNPIETEDCAMVQFEMESGALASSNITLGAATDETRLRFVFEHLTATSGSNPYAPGTDPWEFTARIPDMQPEIDRVLASCSNEAEGFTGFLSEVYKALVGHANAAVTFDDGARSIALVTAIYGAARSKARVQLPLSHDHQLYKGWRP